jgi:hypothetical protein
MTRQCLLTTMVVPIILAVAAFSAQAETNQHYEACQTLGGEYEERRTNCKPECETTYICRFGDGWSRVCDEQGVCEQVQDGAAAAAAAPAATESSEPDDVESSSESEMSFEECVEDAADYCRAQCDDEYGIDAVECARDCLEDQEGQCEDYDTESDYDDIVDGECEECEDLCVDACGRFRQSWRRDNCRSECKSRCDDVCN